MAIKILDNCCSTANLDYLKHVSSTAETWNLMWPQATPIEDKFLKLDIVRKGIKHPYLAGLAMGLLFQIYEAGGQGLFYPEILTCSISIKDKHRIDNIHTDFDESENFVKILGIINSDWEETWGGGFFHNGTSNYIKPTSFCIFDPSELHSCSEIFTDKKRFAIDFTVKRGKNGRRKKRN